MESFITTRHDVLLVDHQTIFLEAMKSLLLSRRADYRVHLASTRPQAVALAGKIQPSLAVVEMALPGGDGLDLIRELKTAVPKCAILVFSSQCELRMGERALRAGARGYLMKDASLSALWDAIYQLEAGRSYGSESLRDGILRGVGPDGAKGVEGLSEREFQIFQLLGRGLSCKEIASMLSISPKTIHSHRENLKVKLECSSSATLILRARDWLHSTEGQAASASPPKTWTSVQAGIFSYPAPEL